jgi:hypothetical protein
MGEIRKKLKINRQKKKIAKLDDILTSRGWT